MLLFVLHCNVNVIFPVYYYFIQYLKQGLDILSDSDYIFSASFSYLLKFVTNILFFSLVEVRVHAAKIIFM